MHLLGPQHLLAARNPLPASDACEPLRVRQALLAVAQHRERAAQLGEGVVGVHQEAHAVLEQLPVDGLVDEVVGARLEGLVDDLRIGAAGHDEHGNLASDRQVAYRATDLQPVLTGHLDVEDHQVRRRALDRCQRLLAVVGLFDLHPDPGQRLRGEHPHHFVVVDDQDSARRRGSCGLSHPAHRSAARQAARARIRAPGRAPGARPRLPRASRCVPGPRAPCRSPTASWPRPGRCST